MPKFFMYILLITVIISCNKNTTFTKYKSINNTKWHKDSIVKFTVNIKDTLSKNTIYVNLRNNKDYDFNNLFLIIKVDFPNNFNITDTLEYEMTDKKGVFLGTGFTDIKENKLEYKTNVVFPTKGAYVFSIKQAMRKLGKENGVTYLNGINDVGLEIEKQELHD